MAVTLGASVPTPASASRPEPTSLAQLLWRAVTDFQQWGSWTGAVLCSGLFICLFWANLGHFYHAWTVDENYSHGFLVPLISLYFANQVARRGSVPVHGGIGVGILLLLLSLAGRLATIPVPIFFLADLSLLIGLAGLFALLFGTAALKRYWFAFFFLVFMIPLPVALYSRIASPLQLLASRVASTVMNASGVPVLCEGNRITLPGGVQMFVAEACSGHETDDGFPGIDDGRSLLEHAAGLVPRHHHSLGVADCHDGQHRPRVAHRLHHALRQSAVRRGNVPHARGLAHDGFWSVAAQFRVLDFGPVLPDRLRPPTKVARKSVGFFGVTAIGDRIVLSQKGRPMSRSQRILVCLADPVERSLAAGRPGAAQRDRTAAVAKTIGLDTFETG